MAKKIILALLLLIFIAFIALTFLGNDNAEIYLDGENVTVKTSSLSNVNNGELNHALCDYTLEVMNDTKSNITTLKDGLEDICIDYGMENPKITIDSSIGPNQIPIVVYVDGTSMLPTLQDGQHVLINKSHDVKVGDIVVANSSEYGGIIKRVDSVNGNSIHLVSDNTEVSHEYINGVLYEIKGISTWVDISDISGVVISY